MAQDRSGFVVLEGNGAAAPPEPLHRHGNIGEPVALDLAAPLADAPAVVDVLSWNVAIGRGRLPEVIEKLRAGAFDGETRPDARPLIVLAQEAYRSDATVPARLKSVHHGGKPPRSQRHDVVDCARALNFSVRYAPSMRNGPHNSDRGNAVLSSVDIAHAHAFPLPHVRQRRVAVAAELSALPWLTFVSAHLDTRGRLRDSRMQARYATGRSAQAAGLVKRLVHEAGAAQTIVIGADLNTYFATREPLLRELVTAGFVRVPHHPLRSHTFHAPPLRMLLDHIFMRTLPGRIAEVHVRRLAEHARDRGRTVFGSDHHPLLLTLVLAPG